MPAIANSSDMSILLQVAAIEKSNLERIAAGTDPDVLDPSNVPDSCQPSSQTYSGCFGLPYQDHNYGAPPPPTPPQSPPLQSPISPGVPRVNGHVDHGVDDTTVVDHITEVIESVVNEVHSSNSSLSSSSSGGNVGAGGAGTGEVQVVEEEDWSYSVTRCICNMDHDDGYMICCDQCSVWQHIDCVMLDRTNIPETYYCETCRPREVDRERAIRIQTRKKADMSDTSSDSDNETSYIAKASSPTSITLTPTKKNKKETHVISDNNNKGDKKKIKEKKNKNKRTVKAEYEDGNSNSSVSDKQKKKNSNFREGERKSTRMKLPKKAPGPVLEDENAQDPWDCSLSPWTDSFEEAKTNQYCAEIQDVVAERYNGLHNGPLEESAPFKQLLGQLYTVAQVAHNRKGLKSSQDIAANKAIMEFRGIFMLRQQFDKDDTFFKRLYPFVLFYPKFEGLDICVDAGACGNDARFVRRSCHPNTEVRHLVENGKLHLFLYSVTHIAKGAEITIPFDYNYQDCDYAVECACCLDSHHCQVLESRKVKNKVSAGKKNKRNNSSKEESGGGSGDDHSCVDVVSAPEKKHKGTSDSRNGETHMDEDHPDSTDDVNGDSNAGEGPTEDSRAAAAAEAERQKNMSREERKMDAIMKAFEKLAKREERRKEALERLALKKQKQETEKKEEKSEKSEEDQPKEKPKPPQKKKGKRGSATPARRRSRNISGNSHYSDSVLSPDEGSNLSMPGTGVAPPQDGPQLTPAERAFRFPKTKKHLMNEWLNEKSQDLQRPLSVKTEPLEVTTETADFVMCVPSPHSMSLNHLRRGSFSSSQGKSNLEASLGSAKKRWLRQAMFESNNSISSEGGSPVHEGTSPNPHANIPSPGSSPQPVDFVTPLKKRRLARESISSESGILPPTPSTPSTEPIHIGAGTVETVPSQPTAVTAGLDSKDTPAAVSVERVKPSATVNFATPEVEAKTRNGFRTQFSPMTPVTPSDNLFEKFSRLSDEGQGGDLRHQESTESELSESILNRRKSALDLEFDSEKISGNKLDTEGDSEMASNTGPGANPGCSSENSEQNENAMYERHKEDVEITSRTSVDSKRPDDVLNDNRVEEFSDSDTAMQTDQASSSELITAGLSSSSSSSLSSSYLSRKPEPMEVVTEAASSNTTNQRLPEMDSRLLQDQEGNRAGTASIDCERECLPEGAEQQEAESSQVPPVECSDSVQERLDDSMEVDSSSRTVDIGENSMDEEKSVSSSNVAESSYRAGGEQIDTSSSSSGVVDRSREDNVAIISTTSSTDKCTSAQGMSAADVSSSITEAVDSEYTRFRSDSVSSSGDQCSKESVSSTFSPKKRFCQLASMESSVSEGVGSSALNEAQPSLLPATVEATSNSVQEPMTGGQVPTESGAFSVESSVSSSTLNTMALQQQQQLSSHFGAVGTSVVPGMSVGVATVSATVTPAMGTPGEVSSTSGLNPTAGSPPTAPPPPSKKKVSLLEYRKRRKDKGIDSASNSASSTPTKTPTTPGFPSTSPRLTGPVSSLPSLPLFDSGIPAREGERPNIGNLEEKLKAVLAANRKNDSDVRWKPPSAAATSSSSSTITAPFPPEPKPPQKQLSLTERLRMEFGLDDEEEEEKQHWTEHHRSPRRHSDTPPPPPPPDHPPPPPPGKPADDPGSSQMRFLPSQGRPCGAPPPQMVPPPPAAVGHPIPSLIPGMPPNVAYATQPAPFTQQGGIAKGPPHYPPPPSRGVPVQTLMPGTPKGYSTGGPELQHTPAFSTGVQQQQQQQQQQQKQQQPPYAFTQQQQSSQSVAYPQSVATFPTQPPQRSRTPPSAGSTVGGGGTPQQGPLLPLPQQQSAQQQQQQQQQSGYSRDQPRPIPSLLSLNTAPAPSLLNTPPPSSNFKSRFGSGKKKRF
ncbi:histone-lysine N-methyltransferase 2E isoform X2 [Lingula anatina]|uniref:Histone-lysine N-methyltransferase 2E isoform X2 n=1 Tax=Lingula anatina TaxID=7574 RepID=A0A1S3IQS6_LINAN|nr:histone-lysine N-methyltransferase 2E isoform X2 [Lingula anatina]|eukprot:XP_013399899.1 histone-lysine N-methyltransferase 2E isoform X2 [Lingula anatina]